MVAPRFADQLILQKEQVEEAATIGDLLAIVTRSRDDLNDIEEYVAREQGGGETDPTAPPAAGA